MTSIRRQQPWLHELETATSGNATAVSRGGAYLGGASGLYVDDRRVVSHLKVDVDGQVVTPMAASTSGATSRFLGAVRDLGDTGPDPTVELHQVRTLAAGSHTERITLVSRATAPVAGRLVVEIGGDGGDIGVVKAGAPPGPLLPQTLLPQTLAIRAGTGVTWADVRHRTTVRFDPPPATLETGADGAPARAAYEVDLEMGGRLEVVVTIGVERTSSSDFDAESGEDAGLWTDVLVTSTDPRLERTVSQGLADLAALLLRDPRAPGDLFAAAGAPWYVTLFGRDSLWAARLTLPAGTDLALGTLRTLARRQGRVVDDVTAEAPGKMPHEVRRSVYSDPVSGMSLAPVYYGTVDATPLWISLLHDAWRWGLDERHVRELLPHLRRAADWLLHHAAPDDTGLLRYVDTTGTGLTNQGWKDSGDSMRMADGAIATAPIALVEAQAYAVEAAHAAAALFDAHGEPGSDELRAWGTALSHRLRDRFWFDAGDGSTTLAMALDAAGRPVDGVGSNMGHVLGTGALTPDEAARTARMLTSDRLLDPLGILTLSGDNPAFNPIGYHTGSIWTHDTAICAWGLARESLREEAARVAAALVESAELFDYRWPELYASGSVLGRPVPYPASCRPQAWSAASSIAVLTAVLGLESDVPSGRLWVAPVSPSPFGAIRVDGLRLGRRRFSVSVDEAGRARVDGDLGDIDVVVGGFDPRHRRSAATAAS